MSERANVMDPADFPVPEGCLLDFLDMQLVEIGPGWARAVMTIGSHHLNQAGVAQAGAIVSLADAAAGWATKAAVLGSGGSFTTVELNANVLRAVRAGQQVEAVAHTKHQGRSTAVVQVEVSASPARNLVATFRCTQLILGREKG